MAILTQLGVQTSSQCSARLLVGGAIASNLYCSIDLYRNELNCTRPGHRCSGPADDARTLTPPSLTRQPVGFRQYSSAGIQRPRLPVSHAIHRTKNVKL